jgi:hypothetical protein
LWNFRSRVYDVWTIRYHTMIVRTKGRWKKKIRVKKEKKGKDKRIRG